VDLVLDGFEATGQAELHRLEHAMILSDSQIERIASLGCFVTFQPEFLAAFGNTYKRQLGTERASMLKRSRSILDAGIRLAFDSDAPIVSGDPEVGISVATNRPDGFSQLENISWQEAVHAYTLAGARMTAEDHLFGDLKVGAYANFRSLFS
jgi:hypothetical protein